MALYSLIVLKCHYELFAHSLDALTCGIFMDIVDFPWQPHVDVKNII